MHTKAWHPAVGFRVPVRAEVARLELSAPDGVDFGCCPTNERAARTFLLENVGQVPAPFAWTVPRPWRFAPAFGVVPVGGAVAIEASTEPTSADVLVSKAVCAVGRGVTAIKPRPFLTLRLSAITKYTNIRLSQVRVVVLACPPALYLFTPLLPSPSRRSTSPPSSSTKAASTRRS